MIKAKKQLGQNFLENIVYIDNLVQAAQINKEDTVIEIGPGKGAVTSFLIQEADKVIAIEIDDNLVGYLRNYFKKYDNFNLIHKNILKLNIESLELETYKLIGSLPYNISKQIIKKFLESQKKPEIMAFIIQNEVALDYAASSPKASFLSNFASLYSEVEYIQKVPKEFFSPIPKVDGAIITFKPYNTTKNYYKIVKFIKSGFLNQRKKLINNLSAIFHIEKGELKKIFNKLDIDPNARASNLSLDNWNQLYQIIKK